MLCLNFCFRNLTKYQKAMTTILFKRFIDAMIVVLLDPKYAKLEEMPQSYIERVKTMHESGGHGSQG